MLDILYNLLQNKYTNESLDNLAKAKTVQDLEQFQPDSKLFIPPEHQLALYKIRNAKMQDLYGQAPDVQKLQQFANDRQFSDLPSRDMLATSDPLGTTEKVNGQWQARDMSQNPVYRNQLAAFQKQNADIGTLTRGNMAVLGDTSPLGQEKSLAMAESQLLDPAHLAARTGQQAESIKVADAQTLKNGLTNFSNDLAAFAQTPDGKDFRKLSTFATFSAAKNQVPAPVVSEMLKGFLQGAVKYDTVESGTGQPGQKQRVAVDPFNPTAPVIPIGGVEQAYEPKGTTIYTGDSATGAALKAAGTKRVENIYKSKDSAMLAVDNDAALDTIKSIIASGKVRTGLGAETTMELKRAITLLGGNPSGIPEAQLIQSANTLLASKAARQGDSNPTQMQINQMKKAFPGIGQEEATNLAMIENMKRTNKRIIDAHNNSIEDVRTWNNGVDLYNTLKSEKVIPPGSRPPLSSIIKK
jgi:hypothetical protein